MCHVLFLAADTYFLDSRFFTSKEHQNLLSAGFMPKFSSVMHTVRCLNGIKTLSEEVVSQNPCHSETALL